VSVSAESPTRDLQRDWWRRALSVLWRPREAFQALRDDSVATHSRQEPITAVVFLSGISIFLSTRTAGKFFDDRSFDGLLLFVEAIVAGALVGLQNFWIGGGAVHLGALGNGSACSYRQARHAVGFSLAPFVVSLVVVWPIRLAVFGSDLFRSGGADSGAGGDVFRALDIVFVVWSLALLVVAVKTLNGWTWLRSLAALALAGVFVALFVALWVVG